MSRYRILANSPNHKVFVGWDDPLQTYFATVEDVADPDICVAWIGADPFAPKVKDVVDLQTQLRIYAEIDEFILEKLKRDYENRTEPTEFQKRMAKLFENMSQEGRG